MMEKWIERWETALGVAPRLSNFFSSREARTVLREFENCAETKGDVEVLAFLLIFFVWPETEWKKKGPSLQTLTSTARSLEQCHRRLAALVRTGLLGEPEAVTQICDQLQGWALHLRGRAHETPETAVMMGQSWMSGRPPGAKRHRAKRQVVFFLTHYFHTLGCSVPPWHVITQFFILTNLAPATATDKHIATWWSNVIRREHRIGGTETLAPHQQDHLRWFEDCKAQVWADSRNGSALVVSSSPLTHGDQTLLDKDQFHQGGSGALDRPR